MITQLQTDMKISDLYGMVKGVLCEDPRTRDNDHLLCVVIWHKQLRTMGYDITRMTAYDLMLKYRDKELANHDSITRARRKVQEDNTLLRGERHKERQEKQQEVKYDIRSIE